MADKWKTVFKTIHGKTPTKSDYHLAPKHVKEELLGPIEEENRFALSKKRPLIEVKRPEYKSPAKKRRKDDGSPPPRKSLSLFPRPSLLPRLPSSSIRSDPQEPSTSQASPRKKQQSFQLGCASPSKFATSPLKKFAARDSPRKMATFTPEKRSLAPLTNFKNPKTPIKSPRKPLMRSIVLQNTENLLLASNEKRGKVEDEEEPELFDDETEELPPEVAAEALKPKKNLFKFNAKRETAKSHGENFVKINLRKKNFVRGKVSAEAKRKFLKKQKWKSRFGGGKNRF
ncbi:unnamed protein product, partial [Mesorhabditis spiculigera]